MTEPGGGAEVTSVRLCTNCDHPLELSMKYCPVCGQKVEAGRYPLKAVLTEYFDTLFNLESRFFRTIRRLFIPGYLTSEFFKGKHVSYYRPLRLFFTTLVILYAVLGVVFFGNLQRSIDEDMSSLDYFAGKKAIVLIDSAKLEIGYDTLSPVQKALIDSLTGSLDQRQGSFQVTMETDAGMDSLITIPLEDIYELDMDSIYSKYGIEDMRARFMTMQLIRARKDPGKAVLSFVTNTSWMILALMPVLALVMKLFYIRRGRYYFEHLVFLFHYHAAVFVALVAYSALFKWLPGWLTIAVPVACFGFLLFAMKNYYAQSWPKTIIKYLLLLFMYVWIIFFFAGATVIVSLMTYQ